MSLDNIHERLIEEIISLIRDSKAAMIINGIRYFKLACERYSVKELFDKNELIVYIDSNTIPVEHGVYDHVVVNNFNVKRRFAEALDAAPDVKLFFKLSAKSTIYTFLGEYNPDWAVLIDEPETHRLYLVLDAKESTWELDHRISKNIKINCGKQHFDALDDVVYKDINEWKKIEQSISN